MNPIAQYNIDDGEYSCYCCCCYCCFQCNSSNSLLKSTIEDSCCSCCSSILSLSIIEQSQSNAEATQQSTDEDKLNKKKHHAIRELLQTEHDYVDDLNHLSEVSQCPPFSSPTIFSQSLIWQ